MPLEMPKGESSCENSPLAVRIFEDLVFGDQVTTLRFRNSSEPASGTRKSRDLPYLHVVKAFSQPTVFSRLK